MRGELADTLIALFAGIAGAPAAGLVVTELDVDLPLEIGTTMRGEELVFLAQAPHSRWQAGFLPPVQRSRVRLTLEER